MAQDPKPNPSSPSPRSMRDFDFFGHVPKKIDPYRDEYVEESWNRNRRHRKFISLLFLALMVTVLQIWVAWVFQDNISYAFKSDLTPLELGDVVSLTPQDIPHNSFVKLEGITEHRGLAQTLTRNLSFVREEFWYFRLLGSRGVFIEVPPDQERFGYATYVKVQGRAIDPLKETKYRALIDMYQKQYGAKTRSDLRVIQVNYLPGAGKIPFVIMAALFIVAIVANTIILRRLLLYRKTQRNHTPHFQ